MIEPYIGLGLTLAAIAGAGIYYFRNRSKRLAYHKHRAYRCGYNYCAGELLRGDFTIDQLEHETVRRIIEERKNGNHPIREAWNDGMAVALTTWQRTHEEISNG